MLNFAVEGEAHLHPVKVSDRDGWSARPRKVVYHSQATSALGLEEFQRKSLQCRLLSVSSQNILIGAGGLITYAPADERL